MKNYDFASISAREYPTVEMLDYLKLWTGVNLCINVSERPYSPWLVKAMAEHGIEWYHFPISEEPGANWLDSFASALAKMYQAYKAGKKQVINCDLGNNRSRALVEALYFAIERKEFHDSYKDAINHLEYNCKEGHLPDLAEMERRLRAMTGVFPKWSLLDEEKMRLTLLSPSPSWTKDEPFANKKKLSIFA